MNEIKDIINNGPINLLRVSVLMNDITIIIIKARNVKIKCFEKKK